MNIKTYNNFLNENNDFIEDIGKDCFIDFISTDWKFEYGYYKTQYNNDRAIFSLYHKKTYELNTYDTHNIIDYSGYVKEESIIYQHKKKILSFSNDLTKNEFGYYINDLETAVLRLNQSLDKTIVFRFYDKITADSKIKLEIKIQVLSK